MFSLRASSIAASAAFILSFIVGIASGSSMPMLILRPVIFAVLFFILSAAAHIIINRFLPELLDDTSRDDADLLPGSRINIMEGDTTDTPQAYPAGVPENTFLGAQPDDTEGELGDVGDLLKKGGLSVLSDEGTHSGMDQNEEDGYTRIRELGNSQRLEKTADLGNGASLEAPPRSPSAVDSRATEGPEVVDMLPDLDSMAGAFLPASMGGGTDTAEGSVSGPSLKKTPPGGKAAAWAGDFNAKDMAAGLRTILSKEKEG